MYIFFPVDARFGENPTDGIGGPPVEDAGTIYIIRDEDAAEDWPDGNYDAPILANKTSLADLMNQCIDGWRTHDGHTEDGHIQSSDALAASLRAAADMLDAAKRPNARLTGPKRPLQEYANGTE